MKLISPRFYFILLIIFISIIIKKSLPEPLFSKPLSFIIYDKEGSLLGAKIAKDGQWRFPTIKKVNQKFTLAITTYEDKRFFLHNGIDLLAIARAVYLNIKYKKNNKWWKHHHNAGRQVIAKKSTPLIFTKNLRNLFSLAH